MIKVKDELVNKTKDELIDIALDQSNLLDSLTQTLEKRQEEMNEELTMARSIQTSLLPKELPTFINIDIASVYMPANKVGGDLYDIIVTKKQKVAILIFDVSGHGIPAALIGAMAKMLFSRFLDKYDSPAQIFYEVNAILCDYLNTENYLTAFLGILDPLQNRMIFSRAGHVKPLVWRKVTGEVDALDAKGFFIGHAALRNIARYSEDEVIFHPGDKVLLYTDGLTEGANPNNELYGTERLINSVKLNASLEPNDFLDAVLTEQTDFLEGVPLRDDFTMLCVGIKDSRHILDDSGFHPDENPNMLMIYRKSEIEDACSIVLRELDNFGFSDKEIKRLKICFFELAINGIEHGNKNNPDKRLVVFYKVTEEKVLLSFIDEGEGFDFNNLPDPLADENILKESGRGVYIVRNYADIVVHNKTGNRVYIEKKHDGS